MWVAQTWVHPAVAWAARDPSGSPHRPDLLFVLGDGRAVAVEVELSAKTVAGYEAILMAYASSGFGAVHCWIATTTIASRLNAARIRVSRLERYLVTTALP